MRSIIDIAMKKIFKLPRTVILCYLVYALVGGVLVFAFSPQVSEGSHTIRSILETRPTFSSVKCSPLRIGACRCASSWMEYFTIFDFQCGVLTMR